VLPSLKGGWGPRAISRQPFLCSGTPVISVDFFPSIHALLFSFFRTSPDDPHVQIIPPSSLPSRLSFLTPSNSSSFPVHCASEITKPMFFLFILCGWLLAEDETRGCGSEIPPFSCPRLFGQYRLDLRSAPPCRIVFPRPPIEPIKCWRSLFNPLLLRTPLRGRKHPNSLVSEPSEAPCRLPENSDPCFIQWYILFRVLCFSILRKI